MDLALQRAFVVVVDLLELVVGVVGSLLQPEQFVGQSRRVAGGLPRAQFRLF
ncbi:hypothetical protein GTY23_36915 [Streptomyces sp. SID5998]|nr:hypothetical protein [Streptomyces sp. SID5998]